MKLKTGLICALSVLFIFTFWQHAFIYPFKLLIVFFHEFSHALMTWVTGGRVKELVVSADQSGYVISQGGSRFLILLAGYPGSLIFGSLFFLFSSKNGALLLLGGLLLVSSTTLGSDPFTLIFGIVMGLCFILSYWLKWAWVKSLLLQTIGLSSMVYVPFDIVFLTLFSDSRSSDAAMLANEFGGFSAFWGGLWCLLSFATLYLVIKAKLRKSTRQT